MVRASRSRKRLGDGGDLVARHEGAADGGAFLPGLDRHLARDLLDEQVELRAARRGVGAEQGEVERVGLHGEADRVADHPGCGAQAAAGRWPSR